MGNYLNCDYFLVIGRNFYGEGRNRDGKIGDEGLAD